MQSIRCFTKTKTDKCSNSRISGKKRKSRQHSVGSFNIWDLICQLKNIFFTYLEQNPKADYATYNKGEYSQLKKVTDKT